MRTRVQRLRFWFLASIVGVSVAVACGQEASVPDPVLPDGGPRVDASEDVVVADTSVADAGADVPDVVCPDVLPDDALGLYAAPTGTNNATCGSRAMPCKTLNAAITRAVTTAHAKVYAARGTYIEKVSLAPNVEIIGGWDINNDTTWKRACVSPEEIVVVRAPASESVTIEARDLGGVARLSLLRIDSKLAIQVTPGESLYGVLAVGATTTLVMDEVHVVTGAAGAGTNGPKGDAGAEGGTSCPAGAGTNGTPGAQGTGAPNGAFDPTGYEPGDAVVGGNAGAADNGTAAGLGTCVQCGTCDPTLCTFTPVGAPSCGKDGVSGCAGGPGAPGGPAVGGGSSIGVYVWDATVTINGGHVKSGDAGNGGAGGAGGAGGVATKGVAGPSTAPCTVGCELVVAVCNEMKAAGVGGSAGGTGGLGGTAGAGGGGGGGSSFAVYQGGAGVVTTTASTTLAHGKAGTGGGPVAGAGSPGAAADRVP